MPISLPYCECSSRLIGDNYYFTLYSSKKFTFEVPGDLCKLERVYLKLSAKWKRIE